MNLAEIIKDVAKRKKISIYRLGIIMSRPSIGTTLRRGDITTKTFNECMEAMEVEDITLTVEQKQYKL